MSANANTKKAGEAREAGNSAYKKGKWIEAIGHYTTASVLAPQDPAPLLNRAQAYLKIEKWQDCERDCSRVLALAGQGGNVKALYRRALAKKELKLYKNAKDDLETLLKAEPSNAAAKEELAEIKRLVKAERDTPNPKKSPKDLSSFSELSSRKTNATASSLPARNRAQGVRIPIKVVPKFTTRPIISQNTDARAVPPLANSDNDESSSSKGSHNAEAFDTAAQNAPAEAVSAFSSHKASRGAKSSFVDNQPIATISSPLQSTVKAELTGSTSSGVKPPSSGLELVDRLQDLAEDGYSRWQLLQSVNPQKMAALLGGILEPDHLALIYSTMSYRACNGASNTEREAILAYMQALRNIPRWQMTEALLLSEERKIGEELWRMCNT